MLSGEGNETGAPNDGFLKYINLHKRFLCILKKCFLKKHFFSYS